MTKIHTKKVPLYGINFHFSHCFKAVKTEFNLDFVNDNAADDYTGFVYKTVDCAIVMWIPKLEDGSIPISTLSHEAFHAAVDICGHAGIPIDNDRDNEATAYLITWITETVLDIMGNGTSTRPEGKAVNGS